MREVRCGTLRAPAIATVSRCHKHGRVRTAPLTPSCPCHAARFNLSNRYLHGSAHLVMHLQASTSAHARAMCMSSAKALSLTARAHL